MRCDHSETVCDACVDRELREMGIDPVALSARGRIFVDSILKGRPVASSVHGCCEQATSFLVLHHRDGKTRAFVDRGYSDEEIAYCPWCGELINSEPEVFVCPCCHKQGWHADDCLVAAEGDVPW